MNWKSLCLPYYTYCTPQLSPPDSEIEASCKKTLLEAKQEAKKMTSTVLSILVSNLPHSVYLMGITTAYTHFFLFFKESVNNNEEGKENDKDKENEKTETVSFTIST